MQLSVTADEGCCGRCSGTIFFIMLSADGHDGCLAPFEHNCLYTGKSHEIDLVRPERIFSTVVGHLLTNQADLFC